MTARQLRRDARVPLPMLYTPEAMRYGPGLLPQ